jgi:hypothetical protein
MNKFIKPIALILVNTILLSQAKVVSTSQSPVKVAYVGIQVANVDPWAETELHNKLSTIFDGLNPEQFIKSKVVLQVAKTQVDSLFIDMADAQFQRVADQTGAQYVFAGKFKNVSPDESRIMIQGDFYRYNAQLKSSYRYEVLKYYERMNDEVKVIQQQMVDSMPYAPKPASLKQVTFVFTGIILIGLVFMTLTGTNVWQNGEGSGEGTKPTEN